MVVGWGACGEYVKVTGIITDLIFEHPDRMDCHCGVFIVGVKIMKKILFGMFLLVMTSNLSAAAVKYHGSKAVNNYVSNAEGMTNNEIIATLREDIATIDNDIALCEKQRKAWIAATIVGGVGIIGTGALALKQADTLSEKKAEFNELKNQVNVATKADDDAERELNESQK